MDNLQGNNPNEDNMEILSETAPLEVKRKKLAFTKLAVIMIVFGVIFITIGHITGAANTMFYWNNGITMVEGDDGINSEQIFATAVTDINVTASVANVEIVQTNSNYVTVTTHNILEPYIEKHNGTLTISAQFGSSLNFGPVNIRGRGRGNRNNRNNNTRSVVSFGFGMSSMRSPLVRIYLPTNTSLLELDINVTSGNIRIYDTIAANTFIQSSSGNIVLNNMSGQTISTVQTSGNVTATNCNFASVTSTGRSGNVRFEGAILQDVYVNRTSGRIDITNTNATGNNITLQTNSGNISYRTASPFNNLIYNARVTSGNIRIDRARIDGRTATGSVGTPNNLINITATSGNISLEFGQ